MKRTQTVVTLGPTGRNDSKSGDVIISGLNGPEGNKLFSFFKDNITIQSRLDYANQHDNKHRNGVIYKIQHISGKIAYIGKSTKKNFNRRMEDHFAHGVFGNFNRSILGRRVGEKAQRKNVSEKNKQRYDYGFNKKNGKMIIIDTIENDGRDVFIEEERNRFKYTSIKSNKNYQCDLGSITADINRNRIGSICRFDE